MGSKGNSIIFVIHLSIEFLFLQQSLPLFKMKSVSILVFAALVMLGAAEIRVPAHSPPLGAVGKMGLAGKLGEAEPPVPVEEVKPLTKGQFLLIEIPDRDATQSRCGCCCSASCGCSRPLDCCCTPCGGNL